MFFIHSTFVFISIGLKLYKTSYDNEVLEYRLNHSQTEDRFFFGLCPVAGLPDEKTALKACSGCYSVCYSGREAQKKHWKNHKSICKALQALGEN